MSHYLLEKSVTGKDSPFTRFFYPPMMFADAQTTLNVLVTLEDAFIAAYLVGVRRFSTPDGFDTSRSFAFEPFTPTLPEPLGDFHSFAG